jgi:hypothetical protein
MTKIAGSRSASRYGSGSISQRHGSADPDPDPDPPQNVMDPQHWTPVKVSLYNNSGYWNCFSSIKNEQKNFTHHQRIGPRRRNFNGPSTSTTSTSSSSPSCSTTNPHTSPATSATSATLYLSRSHITSSTACDGDISHRLRNSIAGNVTSFWYDSGRLLEEGRLKRPENI